MPLPSDDIIPRQAPVDHGARDLRVQYELQVHLAEYNALTMRNTYWITLQYACWPIILLFLTFAAQLWDKVPHSWLIWLSSLVVEFAIGSWCEAGHEIYSNARYIEHELRPKVERLIGVDDFWRYERFLTSQRGEGSLWYEYLPLVVLAVPLILAIICARPWSFGDYVGATLYLILLIAVVPRSLRLIRERQRITTNEIGS